MSTPAPTYTFVSVSTAKPGRLDDLCRVARAPTDRMVGRVAGMLARQVSVDRERNAVVVWATFDDKATLYDYLATEQGRQDHVGDEPLDEIIASFEMYDLTPLDGMLIG